MDKMYIYKMYIYIFCFSLLKTNPNMAGVGADGNLPIQCRLCTATFLDHTTRNLHEATTHYSSDVCVFSFLLVFYHNTFPYIPVFIILTLNNIQYIFIYIHIYMSIGICCNTRSESVFQYVCDLYRVW